MTGINETTTPVTHKLWPRVTGINKTRTAVTLTYDPWGGAYLDDAVGEITCVVHVLR